MVVCVCVCVCVCVMETSETIDALSTSQSQDNNSPIFLTSTIERYRQHTHDVVGMMPLVVVKIGPRLVLGTAGVVVARTIPG